MKEREEVTVTGKVDISFDVIADVPKKWNESELREFIKICVGKHMKHFDNVKIKEIKIEED